MESSDVIAFQNAIIRTSSLTNADVIVTKTPFDDIDRHFLLSNGHLSADENLQFVEAVPIAASELKDEELYRVETCPSSDDDCEESTGSESGTEHPDGSTDKDEEGKEPYVDEERSPVGSDRLNCDGDEKKVAPHVEPGEVQTSLIESMQRLGLSTGDRSSSRKTEGSEESAQRDEKPHETKQKDSRNDADVLARGPTGGIAVAYPSNPANCGWAEQYYPGEKRSQFVPGYTDFGNDIFFVDATVSSSFPAGDNCDFQPSKFRKGPQPVESEDLSPLDDPFLSFTSLSPKEIAEVLGSDDCAAIVDEFLLSGNIYNIDEESQNVKYVLPPCSPGDQFRNGSVIGELFPSGIPASSFQQHLHQDQQQQPSHSSMTIFRTPNPIATASPLSQVTTIAANPSGKFFQPGNLTLDPTQFCDNALKHGGCTGFQAGEVSPPESGLGGSDYSQSPHRSTKGSPGREDDFPLEPHENLAEIEAILNFIENEVQTPDGKQSTKYRYPLEKPPAGNQQPPNPASSNYQLPLVNPPPGTQPINPPTTNYHFQLENPPVSQAVGQFNRPPYSTVASFHPVHSSPIQRTSVSSTVSATSPALSAGPRVRSVKRTSREEGSPEEQTMRRMNGTNSNVSGKTPSSTTSDVM